ncbi:MAG: hypothetical protein KAU62_09205 [Candidatus Heimdallarchaeota archaeon]|nr:hypothetical protein [Candidatus Heimdallarchaeota archaeon]MCK4611317.1 hypothetical protein [Candidatus Heimdallarchaeota archaeon]
MNTENKQTDLEATKKKNAEREEMTKEELIMKLMERLNDLREEALENENWERLRSDGDDSEETYQMFNNYNNWQYQRHTDIEYWANEATDDEIKKTILKAKIITDVQEYYNSTEVKNITEAQARKIRKAMTKELGNRRYFSQSGSHAILNPLSENPHYTWWGDMYWDGTGQEPLVFHTSFYKETRRMPAIDEIRKIEYVLYPSGKYTFNETTVDQFNNYETVEQMMKEEIDSRIFQEITQLELDF